MKILSYNVYGKKDVDELIPSWNTRIENLYKIINDILKDDDIKVICFQEVNENNMELITKICNENDFKILEKFAMRTRTIYQYNIIGVKNNVGIDIKNVYCLPHGEDNEYQNVEDQIIYYGMSDYRTTVFTKLEYNGKIYLIGNIHTDYKSAEGIIKGTVKSLDYMDTIDADYKLIIGDMNMVSHMSEAREILRQKTNYIIISKNKKKKLTENSYHGYGINESVNVDFAFVEKSKEEKYDYEIIKQDDILNEGSDHRPIILTIE